MRKFLRSLTLTEWLIWGISVVSITVGFFVFKNHQYHYLVGSLIGISSLVLISKGNPFGQMLCLVFSAFYGVISYSFRYYGEMITYIGMSAPLAVVAVISWLRNPYRGNKNEVRVNRLSKCEWVIFSFVSVAVTVAFFFILRALHTANLWISTVSVLTSFIASYLTARRSRFYAIGYATNDVVLIVLWCLASVQDTTYLPMVICFTAFLALDIYGFINWSRISRRQQRIDAEQAPDNQESNA